MTAMALPSRRRKPDRNGAEQSVLHSAAQASILPTSEKKRYARRLLIRVAAVSRGRVVLCTLLFIFLSWCLSSFQLMPSGTTPRISEFRSHPLEIEYDFDNNKAFKARPLTYEMTQPAAEGYPINTDPDPPNDDVCQPMHEWQTTQFPACNNLHEIDMMPQDESFVFINCGASRCAFKMIANDGRSVALKIRKFRKTFYPYDYDVARRDGLVMERLHASPYLVDIYGYCGLSQLLELGDGGNLHDLIKIARLKKKDDMAPVDRLKIGIQIASAVSDIHTFEKDGLVSVAHNDICCHQFVRINGVYKLNDFHLSHFLEKNKKTGEACKTRPDLPSRYALVHSPEESVQRYILHEKSDDYMAGNVMYYVLTKHWLFEDKSTYASAMKKLLNGERSPFPDHIKNSTDRADQAMMKGIQMLWTHNVDERPTTREVADFLIKELKEIEGTDKDLGVIRVAHIPPLPKDHQYTDTDYENNLEGYKR